MKKCVRCGDIKDLDTFSRNRSLPDGRSATCKQCVINSTRTHDGYITRLWADQRRSSRDRGHEMPTYSKVELSDWLLSNDRFSELWSNWVESGHMKCNYPSIDRLDDYKGYSLCNIQLLTWSENCSKGWRDRFNGINNKASTAIIKLAINGDYICEYHSVRSACRDIGRIQGASSILRCCKGEAKTAYGFKWGYK